jgi:hypothetical protein
MKIKHWKTHDDSRAEQIQKRIDVKRKFLLDQQREIEEFSKQNHFLEEVKQDYTNYHKYIADQKREQIDAMQLLNKYINDLTVSGELSKQNMVDAKQEQQKILDEIDTIKQNLDSIIGKTQV